MRSIPFVAWVLLTAGTLLCGTIVPACLGTAFAREPAADAADDSPARRNLRLFSTVRPDPLPRQLWANSHFVVSDESDHWLFRSDLVAPGGALIGVGTDNNYTMAGWARPDYLVLMDFDQVVVDVHRVYRAAFLAAPTPQKFLSLWAATAEPELRELVVRAYPDPGEQKGALKALRIGRRLIEVRLRTQLRQYRAMGIPTFLDDPVQYGFIVDLFRNSRVLMVRGDLTGNMAMKDIARVLKELGVPVRALNLSNTEAYFDYVPSFKENIAALPMDENTLILSTSLSTVDPWVARGNYRYYVQKGADYRAWIERPSTRSSKAIRVRRVKGKERGLNYLGAPPQPVGLTKPGSGK